MLTLRSPSAARTALKRKKAHEHSLEQTSAQISMLENQIYSIESANINQETLIAMKNAGQAMKQIHGSLTMDKVDQTLYVYDLLFSAITPNSDLPVKYINKANQQSLQRREEIRDQHALAEEISSAITSGPIVGEAIDEEELDEELQQLEQENLDAKMLNTGSVPVADSLNRLPAGPNGERKFGFVHVFVRPLLNRQNQQVTVIVPSALSARTAEFPFFRCFSLPGNIHKDEQRC